MMVTWVAFSSDNPFGSFHLINKILNLGMTVKNSKHNWRNPMTDKATNQNHKITKIYWFRKFWFNWQSTLSLLVSPPEPPVFWLQNACKKKNIHIRFLSCPLIAVVVVEISFSQHMLNHVVVHRVTYICAVWPVYEVKCFCSREQEWGREGSHS